jgi:hypothetical protein
MYAQEPRTSLSKKPLHLIVYALSFAVVYYDLTHSYLHSYFSSDTTLIARSINYPLQHNMTVISAIIAP